MAAGADHDEIDASLARDIDDCLRRVPVRHVVHLAAGLESRRLQLLDRGGDDLLCLIYALQPENARTSDLVLDEVHDHYVSLELLGDVDRGGQCAGRVGGSVAGDQDVVEHFKPSSFKSINRPILTAAMRA